MTLPACSARTSYMILENTSEGEYILRDCKILGTGMDILELTGKCIIM